MFVVRVALLSLLVLVGDAWALQKPLTATDIHFDEGSAILSSDGVARADFIARWVSNPRLCAATVSIASRLNDVDVANPAFTALVAARIVAVRDYIAKVLPSNTFVFASASFVGGTEKLADDIHGVVAVEAHAWMKGPDGKCL
jgi:hypothetical protein